MNVKGRASGPSLAHTMDRKPKAGSREPISPRYNHRIRQMVARASSGLGVMFPHSLFLVLLRAASLLFGVFIFSSLLFASNFTDSARQFADRISAITGPGSIAMDIVNRSSLDEKSVREVRTALEGQLHDRGVRTASVDQSMGTVSVVLSESIREYVWTAQIAIGTDQPRLVLISLPRPASALSASALPIALKKTLLFSQEQPILDAALVDMWGGSRLLILDPARVTVYIQQSSRWQLETSLPIEHARPFPRDPRGRLLLRSDHLFDAYLPGTICRSSAAAPLSLACRTSDDPWPLTPDDKSSSGASVPSIHAFYAPARNFFTGALSPGIGRISDAPSFYSAAALPRPNYTLWVFAAVDGSTHLIDGITDQVIRAPHFGSDLAAIRSNCGLGTQLLVDDAGDPARDTVRAFEIPDRDPVAVSPPLDFDGQITALWPDAALSSAVAIVKKEDLSGANREGTGSYEAYRITTACTN